MNATSTTSPTMGRRARHVLIASALALTVSLAACATDEPAASKEFVADTTLSVAGETAAVGDPGSCTRVDAPMLNIPTASDDEPRMRIPQPPGWERSTEFDNVDESVRFSLVNTDLVGDEAPDNAVVVTVEPAPDADAQTSFERTRADLVYMLDEEGLPTDLETTAGTVCGLPAWTVTYAGTDVAADTAPGAAQARPVTVLLVVMKTGGDTYLVGLVQTVESDHPTYQRDAETILTGFQVLPPAPAKT